MFREQIKEYSSYDLIEDIKLISQELINRAEDDEETLLLIQMKKLCDKMLTKVVA